MTCPSTLILLSGVLPSRMTSLSFSSVAIAALVFFFVIETIIFASRYRKVPPNQVMIVSGRRHMYRLPDGSTGRRGYRMIRGGGTFVWPILEQVAILSLEPAPFSVDIPDAGTADGGRLRLKGSGLVAIGADDVHISHAAERLLSLTPAQIGQVAAPVMEQQIRRLIETLTTDEAARAGQGLSDRAREAAEPELEALGLECRSFTVQSAEPVAGVEANAPVGGGSAMM